MRTFVEHQRAVRELLAPLHASLEAAEGAEVLALDAVSGPHGRVRARGRVLAHDVLAPGDLPAFANSQMDGYAIASADLSDARPEKPVELPVGRTTAAGDPIRTHARGTASPVMTGAAVPHGADAIVPVEAADPSRFPGLGNGAHDVPPGTTVRFAHPVESGAFVRAVGTDVSRGAVLLPAGARLGPAQLGTLAAAGITEVSVRRRITVLLLSTGHELRAAGALLEPGQIHDANTPMLRAALDEAGALVRDALTPDDPDAVIDALAAAAGLVDLVITTGGVSAGAFEVVRDALAPRGVEFVRVAIQPGGPQGLGRVILSTGTPGVPVVTLPGNPVSALVSFELFLRPVLRAFAGLAPDRPRAHLKLAHPVTSPIGKHQVRRGVIDGDGAVEVGAPSSHLLHAYANATVLVQLPVGVDELPAGALVDVWRIDD